jgi:hypothetical protein
MLPIYGSFVFSRTRLISHTFRRHLDCSVFVTQQYSDANLRAHIAPNPDLVFGFTESDEPQLHSPSTRVWPTLPSTDQTEFVAQLLKPQFFVIYSC